MIDKHIRDGIPGILLMMDIDKFKSINDTYGHDVGDQVIISVANCLVETTRKNDVVMRLGGDEFICFLYNAQNEKDAELYSQRLFHAISRIQVADIPDLNVSVSVGAALYDGAERINFSELYRRADEKVYVSKKTEGSCLTL
jgi:diguanylate cyclase (GGDEF)-like protein